MTVLTEGRHPGEAIINEGPGNYSREAITVAESQTILAGGLVARKAMDDAVTVTQAFAGTGDGALTLADPAISTKAKDGVYTVVCVTAALNSGTFRVEDPNGKFLGNATVAAAFDKEIKFTIADGDTDFVIGDTFSITVAMDDSSFEYVAYNPAGTAGSEVPVGMAIYPATTGANESAEISAIVRHATLNGNCIAWPAGITTAQRVDALQALEDGRGIVVRY